MGLFGFGKKKYVKRVTRNNHFLTEYARKLCLLMDTIDVNEKVLPELVKLKEDFEYTVPTNIDDATRYEKQIADDYEALVDLFDQGTWSESEVLRLIRRIRRNIGEMSSLR